MEKMSVTRALRELKLLDARIGNQMQQLAVVDITQEKFKNQTLGQKVPVDQFKKQAKSKYESVKDLIARRQKIKSAILTSNSRTVVKVAEKTMYVVEAIEMKTAIGYKRQLLNELRQQRQQINRSIERSRQQLEQQVNQLVQQNTGKDRRSDQKDFDNIAKPFIEANEPKLVDPVGIDKEIEQLQEEVENFESDIDIALSESNASTLIFLEKDDEEKDESEAAEDEKNVGVAMPDKPLPAAEDGGHHDEGKDEEGE